VADSLWTAAAIADATGGQVAGGDFSVRGISIDSRSVQAGDLFVALAGERDGHSFIDGALAQGAAGALASQRGAGPRVLVADTLRGLEALGAAARDRSAALRGAVTGSVGKTSVTQAIKAGLCLAGPAHGSVKSYNNHIGVPLTLARMPKATARAVFEIGMNHAGEIEPLARMVRPRAVAVTTVGPVHTENFPDGEAGVARAKAEIFAGLEPGGIAILNADNIWFDLLRTEAVRAGAKVRAFGSAPGCDAQLLGFSAGDDGARVAARVDGRPLDFAILQTGLHWGLNSLCAMLMLQALEVDLDTAQAALAQFAPLEGRGAERAVNGQGGVFTLIDESYNANPISMAAALDALGRRAAKGRRIAVLTDMLELGPDARDRHARLALVVEQAGVDLTFCAGPLMKSLWDALPQNRRGGYAESAADLAPQVARAVEPGDIVMVKGSNGSRAQTIAAALAAMDVGAGGNG
jgi:UDP-N-acetylmuramoyl-tripeptide--D-alanyl-D-alanine ligase